MAKPLRIEVASDVICPWCYIGKRRLAKAIALLGDEIEPRIEWLPFQLNPSMPPEGVARAEYRRAKFGSLERSRELDARVAREGEGEGIHFAFDRMQRTPNTMPAHRLIDLAQREQKAEIVVDALFRAYFEDARDIGDESVLAEIAAQCSIAEWPQAADPARVAQLEEQVREWGISGVPTFIFERRSGISGAYPPAELAAAIRAAAAR
jgi:predicted DsbA family dithiol-disulfide isomerase